MEPSHSSKQTAGRHKITLVPIVLAATSLMIVGVAGAGTVVAHISAPALVNAEVAENGEALLFTPAGETAIEFAITIEQWRSWAEERLDRFLDEPVMIGDMRQDPGNFGWFGAVAVGPDGQRAAFAVSAYAMATSATLVGVINAQTMALRMMAEPGFGDVTELHWSPDGGYLAYPFGTARAAGEHLRMDNIEDAEKAFTLSGEDIGRAIEAARDDGETGLGGPDPAQFLPHFRELAWDSEGDWLEFTTNKRSPDHRDPEDRETIRWRIRPDGTGLERVE